MRKSFHHFFVSILISILLLSVNANAYVSGSGFLCVDGSGATNLSTDFQDALTSGVTNTNNEVRLTSGNYPIFNVSNTHFTVSVDHSLEISGGWNENCSTQKKTSPGLTTLQGSRVLKAKCQIVHTQTCSWLLSAGNCTRALSLLPPTGDNA